jgi:lipopolysaccharide/colanic/teichoic acid biosynthesis glycosyltransferase
VNETLYFRFGKGCFDRACALIGLLLLSPVFAAIAIAIKLASPGPVFFRQVRIGQFGRPFRIWKFRTMVAAADQIGVCITAQGDSRITLFGGWLRKWKLDELPQLLNVVAGQMSLVGPRPEVPSFADRYEGKFRRVLLAKPGIAGPAATAYFREEELLADASDFEELYRDVILPQKLSLDFDYCADIRFSSDLILIFQTFAIILDQFFPEAAADSVRNRSNP